MNMKLRCLYCYNIFDIHVNSIDNYEYCCPYCKGIFDANEIIKIINFSDNIEAYNKQFGSVRILEVSGSDNTLNGYLQVFFNEDIQGIKNSYYDANDDVKKKIISIIEKLTLLINKEKNRKDSPNIDKVIKLMSDGLNFK